MDTTPFVNKYLVDKEHNYDWRAVSPRGTYVANLLQVTTTITLLHVTCNMGFYSFIYETQQDHKILTMIMLITVTKDLKVALNKSTAKWKIVVGHHAIRSVGHHGDTPELISLLLPILKVIICPSLLYIR